MADNTRLAPGAATKSRWAQIRDDERQCTAIIPATDERCTNQPFVGTAAHPYDGRCSTCQDAEAYAKASAEGRYQGD